MKPEEIRMRRKYKNVFSTAEGQEVFKDIVWNWLGTFSSAKETESDIALHNVGMGLIGMVSSVNQDLTINNITKAVLGTPLTEEEEA
jgi:hypothetical protein